MQKKIFGKVQKAGIGYTIGNYMLKGLSFLTIPIFSRLLSATDYGIYNTYIAYEGIFFIIIGLALHSSFKNAKIKYDGKFNEYVSSCVALCFFKFIVILFLGNIIISVLSEYSHLYVSLLICHSFGSAILTYYNEYVSIYYEYKKFLCISAVNAVTNILLSYLLIMTIFNENCAMGRIIGTAVPLIGIGIFLAIGFYKKAKPSRYVDYWKYSLKYSLPIIPHGISQVVLSQFDRIMISNMVGQAEVGIYSFAYNVYSIISVTYSSLGTVWGPWFYEKMNIGELKEIQDVSRKYLWGMGLFSAGIMVVSPEIVKILGTKEYQDSMYLTAPIICGCFFTFLYTLPAQIEYYYEKTKYIALGTIGAALLNIILNYVFIKLCGYQAAIYTTFVTYAVYFAFHYLIAKHIDKRKIYDDRTIFFVIIFMICICAFTQVFILHVFFRWVVGTLVGIYFIAFIVNRVDIKAFFKISK